MRLWNSPCHLPLEQEVAEVSTPTEDREEGNPANPGLKNPCLRVTYREIFLKGTISFLSRLKVFLCVCLFLVFLNFLKLMV